MMLQILQIIANNYDYAAKLKSKLQLFSYHYKIVIKITH